MEPITYSLKNDQFNSEGYYSDIRAFTDKTLLHANETLLPIVEEFLQYLRIFNLEKIREREEYLLELLSFGVLWKSYSQKALSVRIAPFITLARMAEWRKKHQLVKPYIDFARGILTTLFLLSGNSSARKNQIPTLEQIDHVCKWFEATGEFREQALRFIRWRAFWGTITQEELVKIFSTIDEFTKWFEINLKNLLGSIQKM